MRSNRLLLIALGMVGAALGCSELLFSGYTVDPNCDSALACNGVDASDDTVIIDSPVLDVDLGDVGTIPVSWASWPMPNAPFNAIEAGIADANNYHFASYDGGNDGIYDNVTKLYWQKVPSTAGMKYDDAIVYCKAASDGGRAWRVPTRIELVTLIDVMVTSPPQLPPPFKDASPPSGSYWSSSVDRLRPGSYAWSVGFGTGEVKVQPMGDSALVICVAGGT